MKKMVGNFFSTIYDFWFQPINLQRLAIVRVIVGATLFYLALFRQANINYFDISSPIPRDQALDLMTGPYRPMFAWFFWPDQWAFSMHLLLVGLLLLFTLGLSGRLLTLFTWVVYTGFMQRNYSVLFGADYIGGILLLYLSMTQHSEFFTLKHRLFSRWLGAKKVAATPQDLTWTSALNSIGYRFLQIQICIIYAYTGFEKLKGSTWWDGTSLWTVFMNTQLTLVDLSFVKHIPLVIPLATYTTVIFEIYFAFAMLNSKTRTPWLIAGVIFHLGIGLFMGLMPFSLLMISTYVLFWDQQYLPRFVLRHSKVHA